MWRNEMLAEVLQNMELIHMKSISKIFLIMWVLISILIGAIEFFHVNLFKFISPLLWALAIPVTYLSVKHIFFKQKNDEEDDHHIK